MTTTSVLLDKLQKNNLIDRLQNPTDKRSTLVKLSPKAEKIVDKLIKAKSQKIKLCLSFLSSDDQQTLFQILDKLLLKLNSSHEKK
jgi:DNA-binding MarR family transcriptional regulator